MAKVFSDAYPILAATPEWVTDVTILCGLILALIGAATAVTKTVLSAIHGVKAEVGQMIDDKVDPIIVKMDAGDAKRVEMELTLDSIKAELSFNGGKSSKDLLLNNNQRLTAVEKEVGQVKAVMEIMAGPTER